MIDQFLISAISPKDYVWVLTYRFRLGEGMEVGWTWQEETVLATDIDWVWKSS
jgi:hypothetical protein